MLSGGYATESIKGAHRETQILATIHATKLDFPYKSYSSPDPWDSDLLYGPSRVAGVHHAMSLI